MTEIKRISAIFFIILIISLSGMSQYDRKKKKGMLFDKTIIELGKVEYGKGKVHKMFYLNNTKKDLKIDNVISSVPTLKATFADTIISPGDSAEIVVTQIGKKEGRFSNTLIVNSDAKNAPIRLVYTGTVSPAPHPGKTSIRALDDAVETIDKRKVNTNTTKKVNTAKEKGGRKIKTKKVIKK